MTDAASGRQSKDPAGVAPANHAPSGLDAAGVSQSSLGGVPLHVTLGTTLLAQQALQTWQGPFPPPDAGERYDRVLPGAFERILSMAERAEAARIADTRQAQVYHRADIRRQQWLGFVVVVAAMAAAVVCGLGGYPWIAGLLVSVPVMSVSRSLIEGGRRASGPDDEHPSRPAVGRPLDVKKG